MITEEKAAALLADMESDWIERTTSIREDKLGPAVCALSASQMDADSGISSVDFVF